MKINSWIKGTLASAGAALGGLILATGASATTEPVTAEVEWVAAVVIAETEALKFGLLDVTMANTETVIIAPDNSVTDANNNVQGGTQASAKFNVTAADTKTLTLIVNNVSLPASPGYALDTWVCDYDAGTDGDCEAGMTATAGAGAKQVRVGATLTGDGTAVAGANNATFDLVIAYQ
jgi:hypothetical protein